MGDKSSIEWTDATWNPTVGCSLVSPGCTHCYAMRVAWRLHHSAAYQGLTRLAGDVPVWTGEVRLNPTALDLPLRWRRPRRIFVNSMSDLFHEDLPDAAIDKVFAVMALAPQHTFQVLTKRAARMREYFTRTRTSGSGASVHDAKRIVSLRDVWLEAAVSLDQRDRWIKLSPPTWPLPNVWLGVSVEDQARADERIPELLATPAAVRFLSCEPLLARLKILDHLMAGIDPGHCGNCGRGHGFSRCPNTGGIAFARTGKTPCADFRRVNFAIDWVIAGGESGPGARPMHPDWARSLRDQCTAAGVPFFFKQWGEFYPRHLGFSLGPAPGLERMEHVWPDGRHCAFADLGQGSFRRVDGDGWLTMQRYGKGNIGRVLDGVEHNAFPEVARAGL